MGGGAGSIQARPGLPQFSSQGRGPTQRQNAVQLKCHEICGRWIQHLVECQGRSRSTTTRVARGREGRRSLCRRETSTRRHQALSRRNYSERPCVGAFAGGANAGHCVVAVTCCFKTALSSSRAFHCFCRSVPVSQ